MSILPLLLKSSHKRRSQFFNMGDNKIVIRSWNTYGPSKKGTEAKRINFIKNSLQHLKNNEPQPVVFFTQENTSKKKYELFRETDHIWYNKEAAVFIWGNSFFHQEKLDLFKLRETLKSEIEIGRFQAVTALHAETRKKILFISFHGKNNTANTNKKLEQLEKAIAFFQRVKKQVECSIVFFGGDFNLVASKCKILLRQYSDIEIALSTHGRRKDPIDYLLAWPKSEVRITATVSESKDGFKEIFDHDVIDLSITIRPTELFGAISHDVKKNKKRKLSVDFEDDHGKQKKSRKLGADYEAGPSLDEDHNNYVKNLSKMMEQYRTLEKNLEIVENLLENFKYQ